MVLCWRNFSLSKFRGVSVLRKKSVFCNFSVPPTQLKHRGAAPMPRPLFANSALQSFSSIFRFRPLSVTIVKWAFMPIYIYDMKSDEGSNWVRQGDESESAKIVLKQVKWTFFYAYLWQTMWNHAKKSMEGSKLSDSVFLQWDARSSVLKTPKKHQN